MENILKFVENYKWIILIVLALILLILCILLIVLKKRSKVKPIDLEKIEQNDTPSEIEEVLAKLENSEDNRVMTTFEQEQEEHAIISYQELVQAVNEKKAKAEFKEKPIENAVTEALQEIAQEEVKNKDEEKKSEGFKNSEFISPVFGKDTNRSNDDFLKELKDFRNNL